MTPPLFGKPPRKREVRVSRIVGGVFVLFVAFGSSAAIPRPETVARAVGQLIGVLIMVVPAVWLIASGLPKTLGLDAAQRRTRRRIWYDFAGAGFLVMAALFLLFAYLGWPKAAKLVNLLFWLGWTWVSWIYADRKAEQRFPGMREQGGVPPVTTNS